MAAVSEFCLSGIFWPQRQSRKENIHIPFSLPLTPAPRGNRVISDGQCSYPKSREKLTPCLQSATDDIILNIYLQLRESTKCEGVT